MGQELNIRTIVITVAFLLAGGISALIFKGLGIIEDPTYLWIIL
jgi:hypothetical protein